MSFKLRALYITTLIFCIVEFLSFSGIIYGWGALVFVLKDRGYFTDDCPALNSTEDVTVVPNATYRYNDGYEGSQDTIDGCRLNQEGCIKQDEKLNLVFTISAFSLQGSAFFWGLIYDRLGTRVTRILFSVFEVCGCLLIAFSTKATSMMVFPAMAFLAAGGIAVLIANMQVSNLFGHRKSTIMTALSGCFDTSSSIMLFVKLAYEANISLRMSFFFLAGCTILFNINTFILLPSKHIPWPLPPGYTARGDRKHEVVDEQGEEGNVMMETKHQEISNEESARAIEAEHNNKHNKDDPRARSMEVAEAARLADFPTIKSCLLSPLFILALLYVAILQLRMIFFLGTFNPWLEGLTKCDKDTVSFYTTVFVFCQSTGLVMSPLCGFLLDRNKLKAKIGSRGPYQDLLDTALAFAVTSALFGLFSITILIPVLQVQFLTFMLHVITRAFLYSLVASTVPIFFPIQYFGTIYGLLIGLAGIFGLLQYPLFLLWTNYLNNDPFYVNIGLLLLCCVTFSLPAYIVIHVKRKSSFGVPIQSQ